MNAWGKVNGVKGDEVLFLSDTKTFFSKEHGWQAGMGDRNGRWAMVFDHGKVTYAENEKSPGEVSVSTVRSECSHEYANIVRSLVPRPSFPSCKELNIMMALLRHDLTIDVLSMIGI